MATEAKAESRLQPFAGYASGLYAASLAEFGTPRELPRSGGWVLRRRVPDVEAWDATGCYPLFACEDWRGLAVDLLEVRDLVCLSLVTDPFGEYDEAALKATFNESVALYKQHVVIPLEPSEPSVSKHHRYYARKALDAVAVDVIEEPIQYLDQWCDLYDHLKLRHDITGIRSFSRAAFSAQLAMPGMSMIAAIRDDGELVSAHLWLRQGDVVHSHLAATNPRGYELMAPYAIHAAALDVFAGKARYLSLGAAAGLEGDSDDSLARFKRGWSRETRPAYFCAHIFDRLAYESILAERGITPGGFFPAYRRGEF